VTGVVDSRNDAALLLGEADHYRYERRAQWSVCSEPYRDGYFRLFNKSALRTTFVKIVDQCPNCCGWIVKHEGAQTDCFRLSDTTYRQYRLGT
jgi:hypothetical protein